MLWNTKDNKKADSSSVTVVYALPQSLQGLLLLTLSYLGQREKTPDFGKAFVYIESLESRVWSSQCSDIVLRCTLWDKKSRP